jgi:hypothetical protein
MRLIQHDGVSVLPLPGTGFEITGFFARRLLGTSNLPPRFAPVIPRPLPGSGQTLKPSY